jgi:hypothetical protein
VEGVSQTIEAGRRAMREMLCGVDRHAGVIRCRYRRIATAAENR